jgi:hypothetical protein
MKVDFFSAECKLCNAALDLLRCTFPNLPITVHPQSACVDGSCCQLAASYGLRAVPAVVVDGKIVQVGRPSLAELESLAAIFAASP